MLLGPLSTAILQSTSAQSPSPDAFNPGAGGDYNPWVSSLAMQADGKILVGGRFTTLGGQTRNYIGRLNNTGPATQTLSYNGSILVWQRAETSPEVWRTSFEITTNALDWTRLGDGSRVPGGWQLDAASLPAHSTVRARGYVTDGRGSSWFVENTLPISSMPADPPVILADDGLLGWGTNGFGFNLAGPVGSTVLIEASTNLVDWEAMATNVFGSGPLYFSDPASTGWPTRFYRARWGL